MIENPYLFACEWYRPEEIFACMNRNRSNHDRDRYANIPVDTTSMEFATWLAGEYRLAMAKGIELGKRDAEAAFADRFAERTWKPAFGPQTLPVVAPLEPETDIVPLRRPSRLRVLTDDELARLAEQYPAPQEWYDEDHPDAPVINDEFPRSTEHDPSDKSAWTSEFMAHMLGTDMGTGKDFSATAEITQPPIDGTVTPLLIKSVEQYRFVPVGTVIEEGDEYKNCDGGWTETSAVGETVLGSNENTYRRKIKPAHTLCHCGKPCIVIHGVLHNECRDCFPF